MSSPRRHLRIWDHGQAAIRFETRWDLHNAAHRKGEIVWGWVEDDLGLRLLEMYPGGRNIDWTRLYRQLEVEQKEREG